MGINLSQIKGDAKDLQPAFAEATNNAKEVIVSTHVVSSQVGPL